MHFRDQAWQSFKERLYVVANFERFVATLCGERENPPLAAHDSVRTAFDQLSGDRLLALCRDDSVPIGQRLQYVGHLHGSIAQAIAIYAAASGNIFPIRYETELVILMDFAVRARSASLTLIREATTRSILHGELLASGAQALREANCQFFEVIVQTCARNDVFSKDPRAALLLTICRKAPNFISELSRYQLTRQDGFVIPGGPSPARP